MNADKAVLAEQLSRVIAWEISAQSGVERPVNEWPSLIADSLLDFFEVRLKEGADPSSL